MGTTTSKAEWAAFFDFDGVIADSEPLHYRAFCGLLAPDGLEFSWDDYRAGYIGYDDRDAIRLAYRRASRTLSDTDLADLVSRKSGIFTDLVRDAPPATYPGVQSLIEGLKCRMGLALCTGALRSDIEPILRGSGLAGAFDVIVTADDVRAGKPDPEGYRLARRRLAGLAGRSREAGDVPGVAVEDTPAGIDAARAAGLRVLGVATTHAASDLGAADRVVGSLAEIGPDDFEALARP